MKSKFLFLALFVLVGNIAAKPVVEHVEPTYWWVGMHSPTLQIMIHGKDIAKSDVAITHPGIRLNEIKTTDNPNYIFLYINIDKDAKANYRTRSQQINMILTEYYKTQTTTKHESE